MNSDSPFNVEQSLMKARWVMQGAPIDEVEKIVRRHDLPEFIARVLVLRGVAEDQVDRFLNPSLRHHLPNPLTLAGMEAAASFLAQAIIDKRRFAIFGDFDVDGATSAAIFYRFLKHCGIEARVYIPERLTEGYGPNKDALKTLKDEGADILLMLDCGTTAFDTLAYGREIGLEICVFDHHEPEDRLPDAMHVINPKRRDDSSGLGVMCAAGVVFVACIAVNAKLREAGFYKKTDEPKLKGFLDLVALGTVCDVVPLTGVNRLFVRHGLEIMRETENAGLRALIKVSALKGPPDPYALGFMLGPRINAGSRVYKSDLGARLLMTDDVPEAEEIAWTLNDCNAQRKEMQAEMEADAIRKVEELGLHKNPVIVVDGEGWHTGISGLVAGNLKEKYGKPACVIAYVENEKGEVEGRGSGRSIPGVHLAQAFIDALHAGLLVKGGGHAMAGGFTVMPEKIPAFRDFMHDHVLKQAGAKVSTVEMAVENAFTVAGLRPDLVRMIHDDIGPFGQENPEPLFLLGNVRLHTADIVGERHIRLLVSDWEGGARMKAMAFKAVGTPLGEALLKQGRQPLHLLGYLRLNVWKQVQSVEMHIRDAAFSMAQMENKRELAL